MAGLTLTLPRFAVPAYLDKAPAGQLELDLLPVITMAACIPTLVLFHQARRHADLVLCFTGFILASIYHILQLQAHGGLHSVQFATVDGTAWRTLDILSANVLLARTIGHALNVDDPLLAALPNLLLPVGLCVLLVSIPGVTLALCARLTGIIMLVTFLLQLVVGGEAWMRYMALQYRQPRMYLSVISMVSGIVVFALPTWQPDGYWLYHSLWHILMGVGYYGLYQGLISGAAGKAEFLQAFAESQGLKPTSSMLGLNSRLSFGALSASSLNEVDTSRSATPMKEGKPAQASCRSPSPADSRNSADVSPRAHEGHRGRSSQRQHVQGVLPADARVQDSGHFSDSGDSAQEAVVEVQRVRKRKPAADRRC